MPGGGLPSIEDQGRCGYPFAHIDFVSDDGAWEAILPYCLNIRVIPDKPLQQPLDAVEGRDNPEALPPVSRSFHSTDLTEGDR